MSKHRGVFRMTRERIFSLNHHTHNQCGKEGVNHYSYKLTLILKNELDENGFVIDHNLLDAAIQKEVIYGSCEEIQGIIHKLIVKILPKDVLLGYKCIIKPLDFAPSAFIEFIECEKPKYFALLN